MTAVKIIPTKLKGVVQVPPSKSLAHRAIICASLAKGVSRIDNIEYSKDIQATIKAMKSLGTIIEEFENYLIIDGTTTFTKQNSEIDCEESGSTLRFMVPISIVEGNKVHFVGRGNLGKRPLDTFYEIFERQNIGYMYKKDVLDLYVIGKLKPDHYIIPGNISSQFITGLLFALPLLKGDSIIEITSTLESKGYIDLTLQMLSQYGIKIINNDYKSFVVMGNQEYQAHDYRVEADFSQAAFYLVAGAIGNDVVLTDLNLNSLQGDKATLSILEAMGAKINVVSDGIKVTGENLSATQVDASQCPDVIPVVSVALALAQGKSEVINAKRLRIKECDRIIATSSQLNELGGSVVELSDSMTIRGVSEFVGGNCSSFADHRIAMMLAIAATRCNQSVIIDNMECVDGEECEEDYRKDGKKTQRSKLEIGKAIGVVLGNLPSGIKIDMDEVAKEMKRRAPGQNKMSTARKEADNVEIMSGLQDNITTGAPLCGMIYNSDQHSKDYSLLKEKMRPGHSDYPAFVKYKGFNDVRGGGHFSGRITAPIVFAGAIAKQILAKKGIYWWPYFKY